MGRGQRDERKELVSEINNAERYREKERWRERDIEKEKEKYGCKFPRMSLSFDDVKLKKAT